MSEKTIGELIKEKLAERKHMSQKFAPEKRKRSGLSAARTYKLQCAALKTLGDIMQSAVHLKLTAEDISDKVYADVIDPLAKAKAPYHATRYVKGFYEARLGEIYRHHLVWMHHIDGELRFSAEIDLLTRTEGAFIASPDYAHAIKGLIYDFMRRRTDRESQIVEQSVLGTYKAPWSRIDAALSRHVWKDAQGFPVCDKSFDRKFR